MPILRHLRHHYSRSAGWPETRAAILARAEGTCECRGQCGARHDGGRCAAPDRGRIRRDRRDRHRWSLAPGGAEDGGILVILTVAHLNQVPGDDRAENLSALCQYCHTRLDKPFQWRHRRARVRLAQIAMGQQELPLAHLHAGHLPAQRGLEPQE